MKYKRKKNATKYSKQYSYTKKKPVSKKNRKLKSRKRSVKKNKQKYKNKLRGGSVPFKMDGLVFKGSVAVSLLAFVLFALKYYAPDPLVKFEEKLVKFITDENNNISNEEKSILASKFKSLNNSKPLWGWNSVFIPSSEGSNYMARDDVSDIIEEYAEKGKWKEDYLNILTARDAPAAAQEAVAREMKVLNILGWTQVADMAGRDDKESKTGLFNHMKKGISQEEFKHLMGVFQRVGETLYDEEEALKAGGSSGSVGELRKSMRMNSE